MAHAPSIQAAAVLGILLVACFRPAEAQTFQFNNIPVPASFSLTTHYIFYVDSGKDALTPFPSLATVEYQFLSFQKSDSAEPPKDYTSLEVSLIPHDSFWELVSRDHFCASADNVIDKRAQQSCRLTLVNPTKRNLTAEGVRIQGVPYASGNEAIKSWRYTIPKSGKYVLTLTNCGTFSNATISGSVSVMSAHGYLPANELNTMRLFGWLSAAHLVVLLVWLAGALRYLRELLPVHWGILAVAAVCFAESTISRMEYWDWNATGARGSLLTVMSALSHALKFALSWRLLLLFPVGQGVELRAPGTKAQLAFLAVAGVFMGQSSLWRLLASFRHSHALDASLLVMAGLPGALIHVGMFAWTMWALSGAIAHLKQEQGMLAGTFKRARSVVVIGAALSVLVSLLQIADLLEEFAWEHQWLAVQGAPQFAFMSVQIAMMWVWWPSQEMSKYGYTVQASLQDEEEATGTVTVAPEPIGAGAEEDAEDGTVLL
mmetsp:Transcript_74606/g.235794  ORF Transcript_74606/g.235794 Transcript_74606/m.235794 type:complete len:488 (+) Transcript_74606:62-1525(+)